MKYEVEMPSTVMSKAQNERFCEYRLIRTQKAQEPVPGGDRRGGRRGGQRVRVWYR